MEHIYQILHVLRIWTVFFAMYLGKVNDIVQIHPQAKIRKVWLFFEWKLFA